MTRVRDRVRFPLPIGAPLPLVVLLTLTGDRILGLTAFAVTIDLAPAGIAGLGRGAALLADVVAVGVVMGALVLVDALTRPRSRAGVLGVLLVASLVALQAGAVVVEVATGVSLATDLQLARALLLAGSTAAALVVLGAVREHRVDTRALSEATARAEALAESGRVALAELREDVTDEVRAVMGGAIDALTGGAPDPAAAGRLRALAVEVLRPLSHRLAVAPVSSAEVTVRSPAPRWRDTLVTVASEPVIPPRSLALIAAGLAMLRTFVTDQDQIRELVPVDAGSVDAGAPAITLTVDWVSLLVTFAELGLVLVLAWWGAARFAEVLEDGRATHAPAVAWLATVLGLAAVGVLTLIGPALFGWLQTGSVDPAGPVTFLASFVPLLVVTLGATTVRAIEQGREELEQRLAEENVRASRVAARTQAVLAHEQHRLARALHADVQAAVNAASLMLERAAREDAVTPELIDQVSGRIVTAVDRFLSGGASDRALSDRLAEVRAIWAGVCEIRVELAGTVADRVDGDAVARELLVDLVAEACANAVVHGAARTVRVRLVAGAAGMTPLDEVVLTVEDDGVDRTVPSGPSGAQARAGRGLGSEVLRASCTSFVLEVRERGSVLSARVPLV